MAYSSPILYSYGEPVGIYSPNYDNFGMTFYDMLEETEQSGNQMFGNELTDFYAENQAESLQEAYVWNDVPMGTIPPSFEARRRSMEINQGPVHKPTMIDFMDDIPPGGRLIVSPNNVMPVQFRNENFFNPPCPESVNEALVQNDNIPASPQHVQEIKPIPIPSSPYPNKEVDAVVLTNEAILQRVEAEIHRNPPFKRKNGGYKKNSATKLVETQKFNAFSPSHEHMNVIPERMSLDLGPQRPRKRTQKVDDKGFPKPAYSYSCLIALALKNSVRGSLSVSEIYKFMCEHFPFFNTAPAGWKNSVRHNLSLNKCFVKIMKPTSNPNQRKGCLWTMNPAKISKMDEEISKWSKKDPLGIRKGMLKPENLEMIEKGELIKDYSGSGQEDEENEPEKSGGPSVATNVVGQPMVFNEEPEMMDFPNYETPPESLIDDFDLADLEKILNGENYSPEILGEDYRMVEAKGAGPQNNQLNMQVNM